MELTYQIRNYCNKNTTTYAFADISKYTDRIVSQDLTGFKYAISFAVNIDDEIIEKIPRAEGLAEYLEAYTKVNRHLDKVAKNIVNIIRKHNYDAKEVAASNILPNNNLEGDMSHKMAAYLSGQGWIGKSTLLINPYYGPRLRWASVLTNYKLPVNKKLLKSQCDECNLCVKNCPANAFKNVEFDENQPRNARYDAYKCKEYFDKLESQGKARLCGLCVKVCPWGKINKNKRPKKDIQLI